MKIQVSAIDLNTRGRPARKSKTATGKSISTYTAGTSATDEPTDIAIDPNQHPELYAALLDILGCAQISLGRYDAAKQLLDAALALRVRLFGDDHHLVAETKNHLAGALRRLGDLSPAEKLLNDARRINTAEFGRNSLPAAADLNELAALHLDAGRLREADKTAAEGRKIYEKRQDARMTLLMDTQARVREMCRDFKAAAEIYDQALRIDRATYLGTDHPRYITHAHNRATVLQGRGKLQAAETEFRKTLAAYERVYGPEYPGVADVHSNLGRVLMARNDHAAAEIAFRRALELDSKSRGENHPYIGYDKVNLARAAFGAGRTAEAETLVLEALALYRKRLPAAHGYIATAQTTLGLIYIAQGRIKEAKRVLQEALKIWQQLLAQCKGCDCSNFESDYAYTQAVLGRSLALDRQLSQAMPLLSAGLNIVSRIRGRKDRSTLQVREWLDDLKKQIP